MTRSNTPSTTLAATLPRSLRAPRSPILTLILLLAAPVLAHGDSDKDFANAVKSTMKSSDKQLSAIVDGSSDNLVAVVKSFDDGALSPDSAALQVQEELTAALDAMRSEADAVIESIAFLAAQLKQQDGAFPKGSLPGECGDYDKLIEFVNGRIQKAVKKLLKKVKKAQKKMNKSGAPTTFHYNAPTVDSPPAPKFSSADVVKPLATPKFVFGSGSYVDDTGRFAASFQASFGAVVTVVDESGQPVNFTKFNGASTLDISGANLPPGAYKISVTENGGTTSNIVIIPAP